MSVATEVRGPKCPECGNGVLAPFTSREEFDYDLGDKTIRVVVDDVPLQRCTHCHLEASGSQAAKVRHDAVCRAAGYPTPAEQKAIREQLGWSQQYLADLTGYGVATVSRSERGRLLANRSYYRTLLAVRDCPAFRDYLERVYGAEREPRPAALPERERGRCKEGAGTLQGSR